MGNTYELAVEWGLTPQGTRIALGYRGAGGAGQAPGLGAISQAPDPI